jgi:glycosyltransferase involved in cell wall biosynthesis
MVDILMPFYGRVDHFRLAVESVRAQADEDWRLIIVDDVYPDRSAGEWVVGLGDPRIRYLRNDVNLGVSGNFNKVVELSAAPYVVLMGCDDLMSPEYLTRTRALLAEYPQTDILQPGVRVIDGEGHDVRPIADRVKDRYRPRGGRPLVLSGEALATSLLKGNWAYFPSLVWRRELLVQHGGFHADRNVVQDLTMLFDIVADGGTILLDDAPVFSYRRHRASFSAQGGPDGSKFGQERAFFTEAAATSDTLGWSRAARAARWHVSSRLHALSELPNATDARSRGLLLRHALRHWRSTAAD